MFVGRELELEILEDSFQSPSSSIDLVFGSKYSGKTAFLN